MTKANFLTKANRLFEPTKTNRGYAATQMFYFRSFGSFGFPDGKGIE